MSRDQRSSGPLLGRVPKAIGSLIGAGSEAYAHHKEKSAAAKQAKEGQVEGEQNPFHDPSPPGYSSDEQLDEEDWALDELSDSLPPPPNQPVAKVSLLNTANLELAPPNLAPSPVPSSSLNDARKIAPEASYEPTHLSSFLSEFYDATQASNYLQAINIASNVVGMVPSVITMAISTAMNISARSAIEAQTRYKTNSYLDAINAKLFNPRNLHAVVMTFVPDSNQQIVDVDLRSSAQVDEALGKDMAHASKLGKMKNSAGVSKGEIAIPTAAPLVYPSIDAAAFSASSTGQAPPPAQQSAIKRSSAWVSDYIDRRAAAEYAGRYGDESKLALPQEQQKQFVSRYADPNHPANSGGILALLTGGAVDPRAKFMGKRAEMRAKVRGKTLTEEEKRNVQMGRTGRMKGPVRGGLKKVMQEDVLYLLIAEIPPELRSQIGEKR